MPQTILILCEGFAGNGLYVQIACELPRPLFSHKTIRLNETILRTKVQRRSVSVSDILFETVWQKVQAGWA